jgi:hypothetical protein
MLLKPVSKRTPFRNPFECYNVLKVQNRKIIIFFVITYYYILQKKTQIAELKTSFMTIHWYGMLFFD